MNTAPTPPIASRTVALGRGASWLGEAFELLMRAPGTWIAIALIYIVIMVAASMIHGGSLLTALFGPVFSGGLILGCSAQDSGQELKVEHLFAGFSGGRLGQLVLLAVLYLAAVLVLAVVGVSLALACFGLSLSNFSSLDAAGAYVLPLLLVVLILLALYIPVAMGMWLAPALIVLRGLDPVAAFKLSFRACLINFMPFLIYGILALLLAIAATIPLLLGWLVVLPVFSISVYTAYRDILPPQPASNTAPPDLPPA